MTRTTVASVASSSRVPWLQAVGGKRRTRAYRRILTIAVVCVTASAPLHAGNNGKMDVVKRGAYLVRIMGCSDCHMPLKAGANGPVPDFSRGLSGHPQGSALAAPAAAVHGAPWIWGGDTTNTAFWGPWGISYAANLTPDPSGIGSWTEQEFAASLRTGKHLGVGRAIMPPMPWEGAGQLSDADMHAVFSYLRAQPAIHNEVPAWQPPVADRIAVKP